MNYLNVFERKELKYMLSPRKAAILRERMQPFIKPDLYFDETLNSLYYDTPDFLIIRRSLEKPLYKEKIRLRSYGHIEENGKVYAELKKKYKSTVYKRRVEENEKTAMLWLCGKIDLTGTQIEREINYSVHMYNNLAPRVFIGYDRLSYVGKDDKSLRITFDRNARFRTDDLLLSHGSAGELLLPPGYELLEVKAHLALPLWLTRLLSEEEVYKTSFSKYGKAYSIITENNNRKGMIQNVSNF